MCCGVKRLWQLLTFCLSDEAGVPGEQPRTLQRNVSFIISMMVNVAIINVIIITTTAIISNNRMSQTTIFLYDCRSRCRRHRFLVSIGLPTTRVFCILHSNQQKARTPYLSAFSDSKRTNNSWSLIGPSSSTEPPSCCLLLLLEAVECVSNGRHVCVCCHQ